MALLLNPSLRIPISRRRFPGPNPPPSRPLFVFAVRSSLPFPPEKATFGRELKAAVDIVERACRLCVDVKKSLLSGDGRVLEKNDQTPVTIADFSVQALVSLEMEKLFPSIPLVAEEDSTSLRQSSFLVDSILNTVADKVSVSDEPLSAGIVLDAIDRGGKNAVSFDAQPATYWVLDPIDGTKGFLKGNDSLYVVGLALVVKGKTVLGIMGCPNWKADGNSAGDCDDRYNGNNAGIIMIAHEGYGTWIRSFLRQKDSWQQCFVDNCYLVNEARFCIPDSQTWELMPLSAHYSTTVDKSEVRDERTILLLPTCCGSLCKYLMVASGRASVFMQRSRVQSVIKVWDHAAGIICIQEAGGKVTDWNGTELNLAADQVERRIIYPLGGVLVTNGDASSNHAFTGMMAKAFKLDPSFQSVLNEAITSYVGAQGGADPTQIIATASSNACTVSFLNKSMSLTGGNS